MKFFPTVYTTNNFDICSFSEPHENEKIKHQNLTRINSIITTNNTPSSTLNKTFSENNKFQN